MKGLTSKQITERNRRNHSAASAKRKRNIDTMRGRCSEHTVAEWIEMLRVSPTTIHEYVKDLGETCKPTPKRSRKEPRTSQQFWGRDEADREAAAMMVEWAKRPIRRQA